MARFRRLQIAGLAAGAIAVVAFSCLTAGGRYEVIQPFGHLFADEPRVGEIAELSPDNPQVLLSSLLVQHWDYVCFVPPYYPVAGDPKLAGVEIPWIANDGHYTVVLKKGADHDLHRIGREDVVTFQLSALEEDEACYDDTNVALEYVEGSGPVTLRVTPRD